MLISAANLKDLKSLKMARHDYLHFLIKVGVYLIFLKKMFFCENQCNEVNSQILFIRVFFH